MRTTDSKIFHSPEVRVVEASAGSGKTYALAKRYVQILLDPHLKLEEVPIRNILALTFTNKAAFEMKSRILEFLKIIAFEQLSDVQEEEILRPLGLDKAKASQRAYNIMEGLIRHYNFFQVQTIDKFINTLLSGCAFKIGLTANFQIRTDAREYLQYSLDQMIDNSRFDKSLLNIFTGFLDNYLYLEERRGWFPKEDILAIVYALFMQSNAYGYDFQQSPFSPEDLIEKKRKILKKMKTLNEGLSVGTHKGFLKSFSAFLEKSQKSFDIDSVSDYFARESLPVRANTKVSAKQQKLWTQIRDQLIQLCHQEAYSLFNSYVQIFNHVSDGVKEQSAKDDCLFLGELNKKALALFDENFITVEELYYRLAARFRHYLIDEFQDTSRLQWRNLETMIEEALSTEGTLFYVGDKKQAIYGFRGGEVELFDDVRQKFKSAEVVEEYLKLAQSEGRG